MADPPGQDLVLGGRGDRLGEGHRRYPGSAALCAERVDKAVAGDGHSQRSRCPTWPPGEAARGPPDGQVGLLHHVGDHVVVGAPAA